MTKQIVIVWLDEEQVVVKYGRTDIGESHKFKTVVKPMACMWMNKGTDADVAKAKAYAATEGHSVLCYTGSRDPLAQAKQDILKEVAA